MYANIIIVATFFNNVDPWNLFINTKNTTTGCIKFKIKAAFVKAIGDELAKSYYIQGGNGEVKKVELDRGLVGIN